MSWTIPPLAEEIARAEADFSSRLGDLFPPATLRALVRGFCLAVQGLYEYQSWSDQQKSPLTCEAEWIDRHARLWGVARRGGATTTGTVTITGAPAAVLPAGSLFRRPDGQEYVTKTDVTIPSPGVLAGVAVEATAPGAAGNTAEDTVITLLRPVAGMVSAATVEAPGLAGGIDDEDDESLRGRVLDLIRFRPHGGAAQDYVLWAREVPGVTRAWAYPEEGGPGDVTVRFLAAGREHGIPEAEDIAAVEAYIRPRAPAPSLTVVAPTTVPVVMTIALNPDTAAVRAAVTAAIADFFDREAAPGGSIRRSRLIAEIAAADGEVSHLLTVPSGDFAADPGALPIPGTITWA